MKIKHYLIAAAISYLTFLIYLAPAEPIINIFIKDNEKLTLSRIEGSLWDGSIQAVRLGNHKINDLRWSFTTWRLLLGEINYSVEAIYQQETVTASIGTSLINTIVIRHLETTLDAQRVGQMIGIPIGELDGEINLQIESAAWSNGTPPTIAGTLHWAKAGVIVAERADLGDLTITFSEGDKFPLLATITNTSGHLDVNGNLSVNEDGHYELGITLKPTSKASKNLRNSLKLVATPRSDGSFEINNAGELSTLGLM